MYEAEHRGHLWLVLAAVCLVIAGFCAADARHGFSGGTYGAGFRGLPSQKIAGEEALAHARDARLKAVGFVVAALLFVGVAVVERRRG
jgi:hypothetical protein